MKHFVFPLCPQIKGEGEQRRFEEGNARYLQNKAKRVTNQESQQWRTTANYSLRLNNKENVTTETLHSVL